jgi:predicted PurR-regulated permease PerM
MAVAPDNSRQVRRTVLTVVFVVLACFIALWLLYALRAVLLLLAFAVIFSYLIAPLVDLVCRLLRFGRPEREPPRVLAISIVYLLLIGVVVFAADRLLPLLSEQLSAFWENVPNYARQLDQYIKGLEALPSRYRLPTGWRLSLTDWISTTKSSLFDGLKLILDRTVQMARFLPWLVLIPVISFFFLKDGKTISNAFLLSLPQADIRHRVTAFLKDVSETLAAYIRAQLIACFLVGVIEGTGLWLLGVSYPLVFAVGAGLFEVVPIVGPLALGIIAVLVASFHSWQSALTVAGFLAAYRILHDYVIYPRLLSEGVEIHPVVIILAVLCGAELGGVTGVFLSVPGVALLIVCWRHWHGLQTDRANPILAPDGSQMVERLNVESLVVEE